MGLDLNRNGGNGRKDHNKNFGHLENIYYFMRDEEFRVE